MFRRVKLKKETVRKVCPQHEVPLPSMKCHRSHSSNQPRPTDHQPNPLPVRTPSRHNYHQRLHQNLHWQFNPTSSRSSTSNRLPFFLPFPSSIPLTQLSTFHAQSPRLLIHLFPNRERRRCLRLGHQHRQSLLRKDKGRERTRLGPLTSRPFAGSVEKIQALRRRRRGRCRRCERRSRDSRQRSG